MHPLLIAVLFLVIGVFIGVIFGSRIADAVESFEQTVAVRLKAIELYLGDLFPKGELIASAELKSTDEYVDEIAEKVIAKLKAGERAAVHTP